MEYKRYLLLLFICTGLFRAEKAGAQNVGFVQQDVIKTPGVTSDTQIAGLPINNVETTRNYVDGMGRVIQTVAFQASPNSGKDIIQFTAYNSLGQNNINYSPYVDNSTNVTGSYRSTAVTDQSNYYNNNGTASNPNKVANDASPYSQRVFENSPLQRVLQAGSLGNGFQPGQHYKSLNYRSNTTADQVIMWSNTGSYQNNYPAGALSVMDETDEDGEETLAFKDHTGNVVLKRQVFSATVNYDTYYIYNAAGDISYIVPPQATALMNGAKSWNLGAANISSLLFIFTYDYMDRLVEKTVPSKGIMYIVYDPVNRPVLLQDANLRAANQWNYIKYDVKGRVISQGIYTDNTNTSRTAMQTYVKGLNYGSVWYEGRTTAQASGYYSNNIFPAVNITPLAYAYFDDYDINNDLTADYNYHAQSLPGEETATTAPVKGMATAVSQATVGAGLSQWHTQAVFYDERLNTIQQQSNNQLYYNGPYIFTDTKTIVPDFTGKPLLQKVIKVTGTAAAATTTILTALTYDAHNIRLLYIDQTYNSQATVRIAAYAYNELGQLVQKALGVSASSLPANVNLNTAQPTGTVTLATNAVIMSPGFSTAPGGTFIAGISTNVLQNVDYRYNIRGQLTSINNSTLSSDGGITNGEGNDVFGMQLLYDQGDGNLGNTGKYSGKLSAVKWMTRDGSGNKGNERSFVYSYDAVDRYTGETYAERPSGSSVNTAFTVTHGWDENNISYDANGNIMSLNRYAASTLTAGNSNQTDRLSYTYSSTDANQLIQVSDNAPNAGGWTNYTGSSGNYGYDNTNGNLKADPYKGITQINYNVLNRVDNMTLTYNATGRYIKYTYDANGSLVRKQAYDNNTLGTTTDYVDGFVYLTTGTGTPVLSYFPMPEGRVMNNGGTLSQEYIITDQQGNARVSFNNTGANGTAAVVQENSYYGFGLVMPGGTVTGGSNKQLYNGGSEWQNDYSNLPDYYNTFYRNYDAALGRFTGVDPIAESAESMTSYEYAGNNPIMENDPNGDLHGYWTEMELITGRSYIPTTPGPGNEPYMTPVNNDAWSGIQNDESLLAAAQTGDPAAVQAYGEAYGTTISIANNPFYTFAYKGSGVLNLSFNGNAYSGYTIENGQGNNALEVNNGTTTLNTAQTVSLLLNEDSWANGLNSTDITQGGDADWGGHGSSGSWGDDVEKVSSGVTTGMDAVGVSMTKANVINKVLQGTAIESKAFKAFTHSGTVVGAIAGGAPALYHIFNGNATWRDGVALGFAGLGVISEFTGLGEAWDGTVGLGIAAGSLTYDIWDATHPAK